MSRLTRRALGARLSSTALVLGAAGALPAAAAAFAVPEPATIRASVNIGGRTVRYRATASESVLPNAAGAPAVTVFSAAYVAEGGDPRTRPVTFLFNGGPGGATIALREGLGPRITVNAETPDGYGFADNPHSLLDVTDLVFVDPPGVGYSRFLAPGAEREFWGVEEDARVVAAFIRDWLTRNGRVASPRFLVGESYAGIRVGFVAEMLAGGPEPLRMNGVVLVSPSTATRGRAPLAGAADPAIRALPSQAAAAWFHGRSAYADRNVDEVAAEARGFAAGAYAQALAAPGELSEAQAAEIARQVSRYIGFPAEAVRQAGLKIPVDRFVRELLADRGERIGGSDARAKAPRAITDTRRPPYDDPSTSPYTLTYDLTKAVEGLYRGEFGYRPAAGYVRLSYAANEQWNWNVARGPVSMPLLFRDLMARDPALRVTLMLGYYDLTIPYAGPLEEYVAAQLPADRFTHGVYRAGHAVFSDDAARSQAVRDLRAFYMAVLA